MIETPKPVTAQFNMRLAFTLAALAGLALGVALIGYFGVDQVSAAFIAAGWQGLAAMSAVYVVTVVLCGVAWRVIILAPPPQTTAVCCWARYLRDSVTNLLSVVPGAGEVAAARELTIAGMPTATASATTVVDLTIELVTQLLFAVLGLAILQIQRPGEPAAFWAMVALIIAGAGMVGFVLAQNNGLFHILQSLASRVGVMDKWLTPGASTNVHAAISEIYREPRRLIASVILHFTAWIIRAAEAWLALSFMGHGLAFADVLAIEGLVFALRTVAFVVPWSFGVQEGSYVALGAVFGLTPEVALGLSLLKRAREVITGIPCLLAWQVIETRRLWNTSRGKLPD